ncbi:MAG: thioesterase [Ruminiclostridium sp.]|nr:thioesterase [Ruminiclostridium sp.]
MKLFCFPYAGGSSISYKKWKKYLHLSIDLCPVELAGRGNRTKEPCYNNLDETLDDVFNLVKMQIRNSRYALFGHSMGSLIAYELSHKIIKSGYGKPMHLFISGRQAPQTRKESKSMCTLPDEEFKKEIIKLGGTSSNFFEHKELTDIFLPLLKADYKIVESYVYAEKNKKLDCGITVFNGEEDDMALEDIYGWREHTKNELNIYNFKGGHFFINDNAEQIVNIINQTFTKEKISI